MSEQSFTEHRVAVDGGALYVRDHAGSEPAFVPMHGFPDNLHIYDALIPYLVGAGRRVVTFDFLGFGASEKPGYGYSFAQQMSDLKAVVAARGLQRIVPVVHDAAGPTGINYALDCPDMVAELVILNSAYDDASPVLWPEMITLFATESLAALAGAIARSPPQFEWLLGWQKEKFGEPQPPEQRERFYAGVGKLIADNFASPSGSGPAFVQLASQFFDELARNSKRLQELRSVAVPVKVIWGEYDPYITAEVARDRASHFRNATLSILPAGHWLQADMPERVAREMLS